MKLCVCIYIYRLLYNPFLSLSGYLDETFFAYICYSISTPSFLSISLNCLLCSICPRKKNILNKSQQFPFFLMIYCEFLSYGNYFKIELITSHVFSLSFSLSSFFYTCLISSIVSIEKK